VPYKSVAQQGWAHTAEGTAALGGPEKVHEWDEATKSIPGGYAGLPQHVTDYRTHVLAAMMKRRQ
jgi:hypothetical protein